VKRPDEPSGEFIVMLVLIAMVFIFLVFDWWFAWRIPAR
jgi:preprotein translocase subunit SecE